MTVVGNFWYIEEAVVAYEMAAINIIKNFKLMNSKPHNYSKKRTQ